MSGSVGDGKVLYAVERLVNLMEFHPTFPNNIRFMSLGSSLTANDQALYNSLTKEDQAKQINEIDIAQIQQLAAYTSVPVETVKMQIGFNLCDSKEVGKIADVKRMFDVQWFDVALKCLSGDPLDSTLRLCIGDNPREYPITRITNNGVSTTWRFVYEKISDSGKLIAKVNIGGVLEISSGVIVLYVGFDWYDRIGVDHSRRR